MSNFLNTINETINLIRKVKSSLENLTEEENNYMFIMSLVKRLNASIKALKDNLNNKDMITNSVNINAIKKLLAETKELNSKILPTDKEQQNIYKVLKRGIEPRVEILEYLVGEWQKRNNSTNVKGVSEEINYFPY